MSLVKRNWKWYIRNRHSVKPKHIRIRGSGAMYISPEGEITSISVQKGTELCNY